MSVRSMFERIAVSLGVKASVRATSWMWDEHLKKRWIHAKAEWQFRRIGKTITAEEQSAQKKERQQAMRAEATKQKLAAKTRKAEKQQLVAKNRQKQIASQSTQSMTKTTPQARKRESARQSVIQTAATTPSKTQRPTQTPVQKQPPAQPQGAKPTHTRHR